MVALLLLGCLLSCAPPIEAHCEGCFQPNSLTIPLPEKEARTQFQTAVMESPAFQGKTFNAALQQLATTPSGAFERLIDNCANIVGYYNSGTRRMICFLDANHNVYMATIARDNPEAYRITSSKDLPVAFDKLFFNDLSPAYSYSVLRVLDIGRQGVSLMGIMEGKADFYHFMLDAEITRTLSSGQPLKAGVSPEFDDWLQQSALAKGKPIVIWGDPFLQKLTVHRQKVWNFLTGLQRAYPSARLIMDDPASQLGSAVQKITTTPVMATAGKSNLLVVYDATEKVEDFGLHSAYLNKLRAAGVEVVAFRRGNRYNAPPGRGVIVLTAHSDPQFTQFVNDLCDGGYFQGNLVMINSCGVSNTKEIIEKINRDCGAVGTYGLLGRPTELQLKELIQSLTISLSSNAQNRSLYDVYNGALVAAEMRGLWQTSWNGSHTPSLRISR